MNSHKEGELYKVLVVADKAFEIYYGYYSGEERRLWPPTPLYPNFVRTPMFTKDGFPFVTAEQDVCREYFPKPDASGENWCNDCRFFEAGEEIIGVCRCKNMQRKNE